MFLEVSKAKYIVDYKIELEFNNGEKYVVDLENELNGTIFQALKDKNNFKQFSIKFNTIEWENGADLAPEYLYDLAKCQNQIDSEPTSEYRLNNPTIDNSIDKDRIVSYWIESSDKDFKTMIDLFETKNNSWSLFIGHLVVEKLLKALYVKQKNEYPPLIHDLRRLCEKAEIELELEQKIMLDSISRFNINARYDDYKQSFYLLCTDGFTSEWIENIKTSRIWIKTML